MSNDVDSIATPLARGVLAALGTLGVALAVVVVPALAAQVAGTASTATALDAILIALNLLVLGHGGGIVLSTGVIDGAVTLTPLGLQLLLVVMSALAMRRAGRRLHLVREDGALRVGALRDAGAALGAYGAMYPIGVAVLAAIGRSNDASPVVTSAVVSGAMVAVLGGLLGILWSLRREPTADVPGVRVLELLPAPYGDIARSALIAVLGLAGAGMALLVVMLALTLPAQSALFDQLDPGVVGGIVLTLLHLALLPLLAVWAMVVLLGGTVGVGTSTGISLDGSATGVLPALPILGALPQPGEFSPWAWLLILVPAVAVGVGAYALMRDVADLDLRDRLTAWIGYPVTVVVAVLLLAGLATGGIGEGRLVHLGPQMGTLLLPLLSVVVGATALVAGVFATGLIPWVQGAVAGLRERVEAAERTERSGDAGERTGAKEELSASAASASADEEPADEVLSADHDEDATVLEGTVVGGPEWSEEIAADEDDAGDEDDAVVEEPVAPAVERDPEDADVWTIAEDPAAAPSAGEPLVEDVEDSAVRDDDHEVDEDSVSRPEGR
ncbi:cell division protein PerM [Brachybacterium aquaticum]|uniref:Uncharacterized protein n=1 Tax=Brachybacterium aquaticum TaxID=1432564 RepID=A0A841A618_9MICO|nr:DUF6350 family protein [Brachybacterium aquaticum]MBB5830599.1 hypothetical protein [Brachybacterium aquaticum]